MVCWYVMVVRSVVSYSGGTHATSQSHAAYSAFTHGLSSKWKYANDKHCHFSSPLRTPLDTTSCLPSQERECLVILALPVRLGGLGIENPMSLPSSQYNISMSITAPLTNRILQQSDPCYLEPRQLKPRLRPGS